MKVLIVNDEVIIARQMEMLFKRYGLEPFVAESCEDALKIAKKEKPEMAVIDNSLWTKEKEGVQVAYEVREIIGKRCFIVLMTAYELEKIRKDYPKKEWVKIYTSINLFEAPYKVGMMKLMIDEWINAAKKYFKIFD